MTNGVHAVVMFAMLGVVGWAAVDAFGWLHGPGVSGAVYLLMPHSTRYRAAGGRQGPGAKSSETAAVWEWWSQRVRNRRGFDSPDSPGSWPKGKAADFDSASIPVRVRAALS